MKFSMTGQDKGGLLIQVNAWAVWPYYNVTYYNNLTYGTGRNDRLIPDIGIGITVESNTRLVRVIIEIVASITRHSTIIATSTRFLGAFFTTMLGNWNTKWRTSGS
jgi:hypothetical protein